jgi:spermidine dehydrogenase
LLSTSYETIERSIRKQLGSMLSSGGFDPARNIEGITVNRWSHGYSKGGLRPTQRGAPTSRPKAFRITGEPGPI